MTDSTNERLTDLFDRATATEMETNRLAVLQVQSACKRRQEPDANGVYAITECVDCGADIPLGRLRAAIKNDICIECAERQERRHY